MALLVERYIGGFYSVWLDPDALDFVRALPGVASIKASPTMKHRYYIAFDPRFDEDFLLEALRALNYESAEVH